MGMRAKPKFLKHMILFAFIPLVLSIGLTPATSYGNIFGTPKNQMDDGVPNKDVLCRVGFDLMLRSTGDVACVKPTSSEKLAGLGWETLAEDSPVLPELDVVEKTMEINGLTVSYKEGGSPDSPAILLLHGFPTSSHMFRNLIPALEDEFYLVAPDMIGYVKSSMPSVNVSHPKPVSLSADVGFTHATFPEGRSIKSNPTLHNTSSDATPSSICFLGVPKMLPNDVAGVSPIERTRGIKAKSIICFRNFGFARIPII